MARLENTMLRQIIIEKIKSTGAISFCDFMEMALYYPGLGYYMSDVDKIGKSGDYYTSPECSSLFGELIAQQLEEMWEMLGKSEFTIIEYGAGNGTLCSHILNYIKINNESFYNSLNYAIIEKSPSLRDKQKRSLKEKVTWYNTILEMKPVIGCILSNELVDNFSVHQVLKGKTLMEIFVDYDDDFIEVLKPAPEELANYLSELNIELPEGFHAEINLQAINWMNEIATILEKGFIITIDYGFTSSQLYHPSRYRGSLTCFHNHTMNDNFYKNIGKQDITSHVNFSAISHFGLKNNLEHCGFTDQAHFLQSLGLVNHLRTKETAVEFDMKTYKSILKILVLDMGNKIKVLIQKKGIILQNKLKGLQIPYLNDPFF